jgi:hypothetical protein
MKRILFCLLFLAIVVQDLGADSLNVMSWNIRFNNPSGWGQRVAEPQGVGCGDYRSELDRHRWFSGGPRRTTRRLEKKSSRDGDLRSRAGRWEERR